MLFLNSTESSKFEFEVSSCRCVGDVDLMSNVVCTKTLPLKIEIRFLVLKNLLQFSFKSRFRHGLFSSLVCFDFFKSNHCLANNNIIIQCVFIGQFINQCLINNNSTIIITIITKTRSCFVLEYLHLALVRIGILFMWVYESHFISKIQKGEEKWRIGRFL